MLNLILIIGFYLLVSGATPFYCPVKLRFCIRSNSCIVVRFRPIFADIDTNIVEKIAELKKQFETDFGLENMRVVFKDSSFKDSVVKTNALQILKQNGINEVVSV